ncbi:MAG: small multi-drug export protein [Archaeoglobaceae archaeon]
MTEQNRRESSDTSNTSSGEHWLKKDFFAKISRWGESGRYAVKLGFWVVFAKLCIPIALGALLVGVHALSGEEHYRIIFPLMALYFIPPMGKESIIPTAVAFGIEPSVAGLTFASMDAITSLFIIWNFDLLFRAPLFGDLVDDATKRTESILDRYPKARKASYFFLFIFAFIPFQGSGGVTSSIAGRLLSLKPLQIWVVIAIAVTVSALAIAHSIEILIFSLQW